MALGGWVGVTRKLGWGQWHDVLVVLKCWVGNTRKLGWGRWDDELVALKG